MNAGHCRSTLARLSAPSPPIPLSINSAKTVCCSSAQRSLTSATIALSRLQSREHKCYAMSDSVVAHTLVAREPDAYTSSTYALARALIPSSYSTKCASVHNKNKHASDFDVSRFPPSLLFPSAAGPFKSLTNTSKHKRMPRYPLRSSV